MEWREKDGLRWIEADLGGARAAFTTRGGGVSEPPFESLNLGLLTEDDVAAVNENRRRLCAALGFPSDRIAHARQVHGAELIGPGDRARSEFFVDGMNKSDLEPGDLPEADGQVVAEAGVAGLVFVADCLPVALAGPGGVAMLHCGWRGLAAGIIAKGAEAVAATSAAVGPGIGPCCYEVGEEVIDALGADGPISHDELRVSSRRQLDLREVARGRLVAAGVGRVETVGLCTSCEVDLFFSHRRDAGRSGRQAGLVWIEE